MQRKFVLIIRERVLHDLSTGKSAHRPGLHHSQRFRRAGRGLAHWDRDRLHAQRNPRTDLGAAGLHAFLHPPPRNTLDVYALSRERPGGRSTPTGTEAVDTD